MRTFFIIVTLLCATTCSTLSAQLVEDTVRVVAYWSVGDTASFKYRQEIFEADFKNETRDSTLYTCKIDLRVLEENADSYLVEWFDYDYKSEEFIEQFVYDAAAKAPQVPYRYQTNELGVYDSLLNYAELKQVADITADTIIAVSKLNEALGQKLREEMGKYFKSSGELESSEIMIPVQMYHMLYGKQYKLGDTVFYQEEITLTQGLGLADGEAYVVLYEIDTVNGFAYFKNLVEPNVDIIKRQTAQHLINTRQAGKSIGGTMQNLTDNEIRDAVASLEYLYYIERNFTLHYETGYMVYAKIEQVVKAAEAGAEAWETANVKSYELSWDFD